MLQSHVYGRDRVKFVESLTVADVQGLADNSGTLSVFTTAKGTISDDLIVTKTDKDYIYLVTNAGCRCRENDVLWTNLWQLIAEKRTQN